MYFTVLGKLKEDVDLYEFQKKLERFVCQYCEPQSVGIHNEND